MTRTHRLFYLITVLALAMSLQGLAAGIASAQVQTGTPPFGSFGGGPDVINLSNLNSHVDIPVLHKPGRGTNFKYDLSYDSAVWHPVTSGSTTTWQPVLNWGWSGSTLTTTGYAVYITGTSSCRFFQETQWITEYSTRYTFKGYVDPFGTFHTMVGEVIIPAPDCGPQGPTAGTATATDGSGYSMAIDNTPSATLYTPRGAVSPLPLNAPAAGTTFTDRNGNIISTDGSGHFYDTLSSTTAVLTLTGSGTTSSPIKFAYTAPNGSNVYYQINYTNYTVATNFGLSGTNEYRSLAAVPLVSSVVLPDGSQYTFAYEPTPSIPSSGACTPYAGTTCVTARVTSITLPTGGTITYAYSGGNNGILSDGSTATLTRTVTPGGTWIYAQVKNTGAASTTTVTDPTTPTANQTAIQFQGIYETQRQAYQGSTSGTLLQTIYTCYNASASPCTGTAIAQPITQRATTTILPGSANLQAQHVYKYSTTGSLTEQDDYDWGSGAVGSLLKKTAITYATLTGISAFRQQVTVTNGSGTVISQTNNNYGNTVTATSGTPQHTTPSGSRGNLLSINYYTSGTTYLTKSVTYFDTGVVQTITDVNNAQVTYSFPNATSTCGNAFPTSVTEPLSLSKSITWNCTGGVQLTTVDENSQTTTTAYNDAYFWRPASVTDPTSAAANFVYTGQTQREATTGFNSGISAVDPLVTGDGLGRTHLTQVREAPGSANFDSTETDYDASGRVSKVTLPYVGTAAQTNPSAPGKTTTYDALSRVLSISDNSGGSRTFSYSQNDTYITRATAPTGENTKRRQEEFDALGHITSVCEITSATGSGTCGQRTSQTGYWTKYTYDALGRLTGISQNAQSSNPQTRTYVYDLMGRLTSETNPETGTTTYVYDTDATCGTSNGDRVKKTDAVGNVTCKVYDLVHRPTAITYPSGTYASVTPAKHFIYDSATVNNVTMTYVKGRLAEAYTCTGACSSKITDQGFSYTIRGQVSDVYESTPHSGGYYHVNQTYWANSAPNQLTAPGIPTITYSPDGEGRSYKVSASSGQNPVTNTVFNAASLPTTITYGSSDSDSYTYDSNTNLLTQYKFVINSQSLIGALTWNPNHTLASQNITDPFDSSDQQNCSYTHDDLTRLASVNCGAIFSQTFSYDAFGNISKSGTYSFQPIYKDTSGNTTNRFVSIPGTTVSYDANGSVLSDGSHTYTWASDGKSLSVDSVNLTYDAFGRMVEQNRSGSYTQILYSPDGGKLALMNGQTLQKGLIGLPGGGQAVYGSSGLLYYGHSDHLGSIKLGSTPSRTVSFALAYAPFGESYAPYPTSGATGPAFTGQRQDTVAGLFDFPARQYSTQGRWPTPDPSGLASVNLSDPQTLNRYAYVRNNPLAMVDPNGLCSVWYDDYDGEDCSGDGGGGLGDGGQDPTSGGDQSNSGSNCASDDPLCLGGGLPGGIPTTNPLGISNPGPGPGDQFSNFVDAALIAGIYAYWHSSDTTEWAGEIYYNPDTSTYSFDTGREGPQGSEFEKESYIYPSAVPDGTLFVADYHSHGTFPTDVITLSDDTFSQADMDNMRDRSKSYNNNPYNVQIYLGSVLATNEGQILFYGPQLQQVIPLCSTCAGPGAPPF